MAFAPYQSTMFSAPTPSAARQTLSANTQPQAGLPAPQLSQPQEPQQQGNSTPPEVQNAESNMAKQGIQSILGTSSDEANALTQKLASSGHPVAQGLASQSTLTSPQASSTGSSLMSGLNGVGNAYGSNFDNSMGGQAVNGMAENTAGDGYGAQAASWLSSLFM